MKRIKKLIERFKDWLIHKLGGYTWANVTAILDASFIAHLEALKPWEKAVQEICRKTDTQYYGWACEYCKRACDKRNSWCRKFFPEFSGLSTDMVIDTSSKEKGGKQHG